MKRSAVREVSRGGFYLGLEQLTTIVGGVFYSIIVLRMLGPATYGILNLGQAAIGLMGILTTNIETYLERFVGELDARGRGGILRRLVWKILLTKGSLALAAGLGVFLLADLFATAYGYRDLRRLLPVLAPLIFLEAAGYTLRVTLFGLQRFRSIWLIALANNALKLAVVGLLWSLGEGVVALVVGLVLVQGATLVLYAILALRSLPKGDPTGRDAPTFREIWRYVLPLQGARVFFLSGQHLGRLILGALLPARELGLAAFALMTIERFIALAGSIPNALLPSLSRLRGEGRDDSIEKVVTEGYRLVATLSLLLSSAVFFLAREAVLITGGPQYLAAILPLQILAMVPLFRTMQQPLNMSFYTFEMTRAVFWLAVLKFLTELGAYPILVPWLGVEGVALASLFSSIVVFGPTTWIANRLFPSSRGVRGKVTWIVWGAAAGAVVVGLLLRKAAEPWPGLTLRLAALACGWLLLLSVGKTVRASDLTRLGEASRRETAARILRRVAALIRKLQRDTAPAG